MSNEDLLAGLTPAAETPKRRPGRPAKPVVQITGQTGVTTETVPLVPASTSETLPDLQGGATDAGVNAAEAPIDPAPMTFTPEQEAKIAAELAKFDAKVNSLTPVSVDYTLAMANRITQIGGKREYAYQRILRQGKKL